MRPEDWGGAQALGVVFSAPGDRVAFWINGGPSELDAHLPAARAGHRWVRTLASREPDEAGDERLAPRSVTIWVEAQA